MNKDFRIIHTNIFLFNFTNKLGVRIKKIEHLFRFRYLIFFFFSITQQLELYKIDIFNHNVLALHVESEEGKEFGINRMMY